MKIKFLSDIMILVTGGAGYIGSHINKLLNNSGYETIVLDNLSKGHKSAVKWGQLVNADLSDTDKLREIFISSIYSLNILII